MSPAFATKLEEETIIGKNIFLAEGKPVKDLAKKDDYIIKQLSLAGVLLAHQSFFEHEQKKDLFITYPELHKAFIAKRFFIEGFSEYVEREGVEVLVQNFDALKRAILDTAKQIELNEKNEVLKQKEEAIRMKQEELKQKAELADVLTAENETLLKEKQNLEQKIESNNFKRRAKKVAKSVRNEEETRMAQEREQEEARLAEAKRKKRLLSESLEQQQRFRFMARNEF